MRTKSASLSLLIAAGLLDEVSASGSGPAVGGIFVVIVVVGIVYCFCCKGGSNFTSNFFSGSRRQQSTTVENPFYGQEFRDWNQHLANRRTQEPNY